MTVERITIDEHRARLILNAAHAAWSNGDIEGVLNQYTDDLTYWSNTGAPDGGPLVIEGKDGLREMLNSIVAVAESVSVAEYFRFIDGTGRANIECYIRHKTTGHTMVGSYRQVVTYRGDRISRTDEFHDAARMAAFWRMITGEAAIEKALMS
jgi:ketosteroid isomerase-like protein